jgi:hypothetical protein
VAATTNTFLFIHKPVDKSPKTVDNSTLVWIKPPFNPFPGDRPLASTPHIWGVAVLLPVHGQTVDKPVENVDNSSFLSPQPCVDNSTRSGATCAVIKALTPHIYGKILLTDLFLHISTVPTITTNPYRYT